MMSVLAKLLGVHPSKGGTRRNLYVAAAGSAHGCRQIPCYGCLPDSCMSVISLVISKACTAHASDSFLTELKNGTHHIRESKQSKISRVPAFRGALAYWGLALYAGPKWSTHKWLDRRAAGASQSADPEKFASALAHDLGSALAQLGVTGITSGIGIHFTAYERVNGQRIPELFLISNWTDTSYSAVTPGPLRVTRETFHAISGKAPAQAHALPAARMQVHAFLQAGNILTFNNGDPLLYGPAAAGIFTMLQRIALRGQLSNTSSMRVWASLARRPVEIVSKAQQDFCRLGQRLVGGKPHELVIDSTGQYFSSTGD
jgi:hypothetical protein